MAACLCLAVGVAWHEGDLYVSSLDRIVKLPAIDRKTRFQIEDAFEHLLYRRDACAHGRLPAQLGFQVRRGTQVVGMCMGFQNPVHLQALTAHKLNHLVSRSGAGTPRLGVKVQHRIDDGACRARFLKNHISHRPSNWVKNAVNLGTYLGIRHGECLLN